MKLATVSLKSTASAAIVLRACLIDSQITAINGMTFQRIDSSLAFVTISHSDECKSSRAAAHSIGDDMNVGDGAVT